MVNSIQISTEKLIEFVIITALKVKSSDDCFGAKRPQQKLKQQQQQQQQQ